MGVVIIDLITPTSVDYKIITYIGKSRNFLNSNLLENRITRDFFFILFIFNFSSYQSNKLSILKLKLSVSVYLSLCSPIIYFPKVILGIAQLFFFFFFRVFILLYLFIINSILAASFHPLPLLLHVFELSNDYPHPHYFKQSEEIVNPFLSAGTRVLGFEYNSSCNAVESYYGFHAFFFT